MCLSTVTVAIAVQLTQMREVSSVRPRHTVCLFAACGLRRPYRHEPGFTPGVRLVHARYCGPTLSGCSTWMPSTSRRSQPLWQIRVTMSIDA